jgi:fumarate reductase subunit C
MSRFKPVAGAYVRPTRGWWLKNPYFVLYMVREGTAVSLTVYAVILLVGLSSLAIGEAAYNAWRAALSTSWALGFHAVALVVIVYHSVTWFGVMPKTAPRLPFDPVLITKAGRAAAAGVSVLIIAILWWTA